MSRGKKILMLLEKESNLSSASGVIQSSSSRSPQPDTACKEKNDLLILKSDDDLFDVLDNYLIENKIDELVIENNVGNNEHKNSTLIENKLLTENFSSTKQTNKVNEQNKDPDQQDLERSKYVFEENVSEQTDQIVNNSDAEGEAITMEIVENQEDFIKQEEMNEENRYENQIMNTVEAGQENFTMEIDQDQHEDVIDTDQEGSTMETDQNDGGNIAAQKTSQEETKKKRALGLPYMGYKRSGLKVINNISKPQRTLKKRFSHKNLETPNSRSFLCAAFTEEESQLLTNFGNLNLGRKNARM